MRSWFTSWKESFLPSQTFHFKLGLCPVQVTYMMGKGRYLRLRSARSSKFAIFPNYLMKLPTFILKPVCYFLIPPFLLFVNFYVTPDQRNSICASLLVASRELLSFRLARGGG